MLEVSSAPPTGAATSRFAVNCAASARMSVPTSEGAQREHVLQRRDLRLQFGGAFLEVVRIEDEGLDLGVTGDVEVVGERTHGVEGAVAAARDHRGAHRNEHLGPILRQHRDRRPPPADPPDGGECLFEPADLVAHLAAGEDHVPPEVQGGLVGAAVECSDQQIRGEHGAVQVGVLLGHGHP